MRNLILILIAGMLLSSCISSKKAYNHVAGDNVVDAREQEIIRNKYRGLFPEITLPPVKGGTGIDSSAYNAAIENQNILLDQLILAQSFIDSITNKPPCDISAGDSARIVKNFLRNYRPPPVNIHDTVEVPTISSDAQATIASQQGRISGLLAENTALTNAATTAIQTAQDKKKTNNFLWIIVAVLGIGNALQIYYQIKRP